MASNSGQPSNEQLIATCPFLIQRDWTAYTPEQHAAWSKLVRRYLPQLREYACQEYLDGF